MPSPGIEQPPSNSAFGLAGSGVPNVFSVDARYTGATAPTLPTGGGLSMSGSLSTSAGSASGGSAGGGGAASPVRTTLPPTGAVSGAQLFARGLLGEEVPDTDPSLDRTDLEERIRVARADLEDSKVS